MSRTVAIIGASADPSKFGNKAIHAYRRQGWTVIPITPKPGPLEGLETFASISDVSVHVNRVSLYLPPHLGLGVLEAIKQKQPDEFYVNPGAESDELIEQAERLGLHPIVACSIVEIGERP